jgi:hypothetical protein
VTFATAIEAIPFMPFPSIARLSRDMIVTEKLDGTNAQIYVTTDGLAYAGSRNRWITPEADNFGFARWVKENEIELVKQLGPGQHFGEWWGQGIQRTYGLTEKRFSLFNVSRWKSPQTEGQTAEGDTSDTRCYQAPLCHVVPVLSRWTFDTGAVDNVLARLQLEGSVAAPGFMKPEGVVVYHTKSNGLYKKTLDKNDGHKGAA